MEWLNLHVSTLDSDEFLGAAPVERATWLCLMRYCIGQENGGRIHGAKGWADRKLQQILRVTRQEVESVCGLWSFDGSDLVVWSYPIEREKIVHRNREAGRSGGKARTKAKTEASRNNGIRGGRSTQPKRNPSGTQAPNPSENPTEGEGEREGEEERKGEARARARPPSEEQDAPEWKLAKAKSFRLQIEDLRTVISRYGSWNHNDLSAENREKLANAPKQIRELEIKILGLGVQP